MPSLFEIWSKSWRRQRVQSRLNNIVRASLKSVREAIVENSPPVLSHMFYGSIGIDPRYLVVWFIFETDAHLGQARTDGLADAILQRTRDELQVRGYPKPLDIQIGFATREDVRRKTGGNHRQYFN